MQLERIADVALNVEAQPARHALGRLYLEVDFVIGAFDLKDLSQQSGIPYDILARCTLWIAHCYPMPLARVWCEADANPTCRDLVVMGRHGIKRILPLTGRRSIARPSRIHRDASDNSVDHIAVDHIAEEGARLQDGIDALALLVHPLHLMDSKRRKRSARLWCRQLVWAE
jgi:hypothetical protein